MGTPLPPNEPGDDCTRCFGIGKKFGDGPTPKFITLTITELTPGDNWNPDLENEILIPHILEQTVYPCFYTLQTPNMNYSWGFAGTYTYVFVEDRETASSYLSRTDYTRCLKELRDEYTSPTMVGAYGGLGVIDWNPEDLV